MAERKLKYRFTLTNSISYLDRSRRQYINEHLTNPNARGLVCKAILHLNRNPGCSQDFLCSNLIIDKSNGARLCRNMEENGFIVRKQSDEDRRQYNIYLTELGHEALVEIEALFNQWRSLITQGFSEEERETLMHFIDRMIDNVQNSKKN